MDIPVCRGGNALESLFQLFISWPYGKRSKYFALRRKE
jgi:hypothetical protein